MLVTTLCAIGSAIAAYELFALDTDRRTALFAATLLCLFPGSIFLLAPMTESLFLLTSLLCMYMCRKRNTCSAAFSAALRLSPAPLEYC